MTVAVLGGSGFIGGAVVGRLLAHGETPVVIARGKHPKPTVPVVFEEADRMDSARLVEIFRAHDIDTVIDILALTMRNTAPILEAMTAIGGRYVLISSVDVYANYGGLIGKDQPAILTAPAKEDDPLRALRYPFRDPEKPDDFFHDYDKIVIEDAALAEDGFESTVVRLPMVFGPGDGQHRFAWAIEAVKVGGDLIALDERAARWSNTYGYVADVAEAIVLAALHPKAAGRTYNAGQPFARTPLEWLLTFGFVMGRRIEVETVPAERKGLMWEMAETTDLRYPLTVDTTRIREELGFTEPTPELDALRMTIADEERHLAAKT
jgi:nucleoside-diphosphate-sugar epimerase